MPPSVCEPRSDRSRLDPKASVARDRLLLGVAQRQVVTVVGEIESHAVVNLPLVEIDAVVEKDVGHHRTVVVDADLEGPHVVIHGQRGEVLLGFGEERLAGQRSGNPGEPHRPRDVGRIQN